MKTLKYLVITLMAIIVFAACQKEYSMESGLVGTIATGALQRVNNNCAPVTVHGTFVKDSVLSDTGNYVVVQVDIATPGIYRILSDTANGFTFQDSGYIGATGLQSFRLKAHGTPILAQTTDFIVLFDTTFCSFSVNVTDTAPVVQPPVTSGDYFPTSDYSNWSYTETNTGDTGHVAVATTEEVFAGNTYRTFVTTSPSIGRDSSFYRKAPGIYYQYGDLNEFALYDTVMGMGEYMFMQDNLPVNSLWESPEFDASFQGNPGKAKVVFTITGKDIQTTVGSSVVDSVISIKRDYMFQPAITGTYQPLGTVNFYYAKNIGFIKAEANAPFPVTFLLTSYQIYY